MVLEHIVVDGSNIATEGRSAPSLAQLETACSELRREYPDAEVTVIVDATFAHRIDPSELDRFEAAVLASEYVHPPAGAIGRGDAFLLRVAEKVDGTVLSNDSFQEFHGEHPWLFERGRLIGGTPVPGVGWIFTPRTPVRGPTSRKAVKDTVRAKKKVSRAIEVATKEVVSPGGAPAARGDGDRVGAKPSNGRRSRAQTTAAVVNDPLTFISFIADHPLGTTVDGTVQTYTSHGAVVMMGTAQGYVPLANLSDPPPRSAREVLKRGEHRKFVVKALDPMRRGVELALPGVAAVSGTPSEEMIAGEMQMARKNASVAKRASGRKAAKADAGKPAARKEARAGAGKRAGGKGARKADAGEPAAGEPAVGKPAADEEAPAKADVGKPAIAKRVAGKEAPAKADDGKRAAGKRATAKPAAGKEAPAGADDGKPAAGEGARAMAGRNRGAAAKAGTKKAAGAKGRRAKMAAPKPVSVAAAEAEQEAAQESVRLVPATAVPPDDEAPGEGETARARTRRSEAEELSQAVPAVRAKAARRRASANKNAPEKSVAIAPMVAQTALPSPSVAESVSPGAAPTRRGRGKASPPPPEDDPAKVAEAKKARTGTAPRRRPRAPQLSSMESER